MSDTRDFTVIGENIHATRIVRRTDPSVGTLDDGREGIAFVDGNGATRWLPVPETEQSSATYVEGKIKHVRVAIQTAMGETPGELEDALAYLESMVRAQVAGGADYLDLNVDEVSIEISEQVDAMRWLVQTVSAWSDVPLAIDSPSVGVLSAGIAEALAVSAEPPMVNSASFERLDALDLTLDAGGPVVVTATGEAGMPTNAAERVANATRLVELAVERGIALDRIHVDPLVFPIAVDGSSGADCLATYRELRERFGPEIHLTGGISNVSFGLPHRRLLNDAFLVLAMEAGADSGILDPIASPLDRVHSLDRETLPFRLAVDALTGADPGCRAYLRAYRAGELDPAQATS